MIKNRLEVTEKIIATKVSKGLTWEKVAKEVGLSKEWVTAACLGQMTLNDEQANKVGDLFNLNENEIKWLKVVPYKGSLSTSGTFCPCSSINLMSSSLNSAEY